MKLEGMAAKTNEEELWNMTQDYQSLFKAEAEYKAALLADPIFRALKLDPTNVTRANNAAGVALYGADGVPNTFLLQSLSSIQLLSVSLATGISEIQLADGRAQARKNERGNVASTSTSAQPTTSADDGASITSTTLPIMTTRVFEIATTTNKLASTTTATPARETDSTTVGPTLNSSALVTSTGKIEM